MTQAVLTSDGLRFYPHPVNETTQTYRCRFRHLSRGETAIHHELSAGNEGRLVRGEKQDRIGDIESLAVASERRSHCRAIRFNEAPLIISIFERESVFGDRLSTGGQLQVARS